MMQGDDGNFGGVHFWRGMFRGDNKKNGPGRQKSNERKHEPQPRPAYERVPGYGCCTHGDGVAVSSRNKRASGPKNSTDMGNVKDLSAADTRKVTLAGPV